MFKNKLGTIPFVCENQEKAWKNRFLTFFQVYEINKKTSLGSGPQQDS